MLNCVLHDGARALTVTQAAEKLVEVRQTVFEILADIPYRVRSIKKLQLLYELDPSQKGFTAELHEISGEVYDGILNVIGVTIKWLATKC